MVMGVTPTHSRLALPSENQYSKNTIISCAFSYFSTEYLPFVAHTKAKKTFGACGLLEVCNILQMVSSKEGGVLSNPNAF